MAVSFHTALRAGLRLVTLIDESFAAAIAYADRHGQEEKVLVVDVGGEGGCIAALVSQKNEVAMISSSRHRLPGGIDFDESMIRWLLEVLLTFLKLHPCHCTFVMDLVKS